MAAFTCFAVLSRLEQIYNHKLLKIISYNSSRQPSLGKQLAPPLQNLSADLPKISAPPMSQLHRFWLNLAAPLNMELYEDIDTKIIQHVMKIIKSHNKGVRETYKKGRETKQEATSTYKASSFWNIPSTQIRVERSCFIKHFSLQDIDLDIQQTMNIIKI